MTSVDDHIAHLQGKDWVPTTNLERTLDEMRKRGLDRWVESLEAFFNSTGAAYSAWNYHDQRTRAVAAEARVAALEEAAQAVVDEHMSAYKAFGSHSALGRLSSLLMARAALGGNREKEPE